MDAQSRPSTSLFEVYLRLRPSPKAEAERFLDVEPSSLDRPTHITIKPPASDHRKRAIERFAFTRVFEERSSQLDIFKDIGVLPLVEGVLGADGKAGREGLLATLGVTGSGKVREPFKCQGSKENLLTFITESYNPRIKNSTRPYTVIPRCPVSVTFYKHRQSNNHTESLSLLSSI